MSADCGSSVSIPPPPASGTTGRTFAVGDATRGRSASSMMLACTTTSACSAVAIITSGLTVSMRALRHCSIHTPPAIPTVATLGPQSHPRLHAGFRMNTNGSQPPPSPLNGREPSLASSARMCLKGEVKRTSSSLRPGRIAFRTSNRCGKKKLAAEPNTRSLIVTSATVSRPLKTSSVREESFSLDGSVPSHSNSQPYSQSALPIQRSRSSASPRSGDSINPASMSA